MIYEKESSESENSDEYFFGEDGEDWLFGEDGEDFFGEDDFMNDPENNTMLLPQESPLWNEQDEVKVEDEKKKKKKNSFMGMLRSVFSIGGKKQTSQEEVTSPTSTSPKNTTKNTTTSPKSPTRKSTHSPNGTKRRATRRTRAGTLHKTGSSRKISARRTRHVLQMRNNFWIDWKDSNIFCRALDTWKEHIR